MLSPAIVALVVCSALVGSLLLVAAWNGTGILRFWDITSGSELQLALERRTYLVSTIVAVSLPLQLFSLFLFVHTVDGMSHLFTGAMCAAGALKVNRFGYPTLLLKILAFLLAGEWLILNHADNQGSDYPLIRVKYLLLLILAPLVVSEGALQALYFWRLRPDIVTSCCGTLFSPTSGSVAADLIAAPVVPMEIAFFSVIAATIAFGASFVARKRGGYLLGAASAIACITTLTAVISFVSPYIYELPSHHCPFCLLQREYHFIGYLLYGMLFSGTVSGVGVAILEPFRETPSIRNSLPGMQQKLALFALLSFALVALVVILEMAFSTLRLASLTK